MAISKLTIIKIVELVLICICITLHYYSFECGFTIIQLVDSENTIHRTMLITGTFIGYIIIIIGGAAGHLLQAPIDRRVDIFFSLLGCTLFVACGAWIIDTYQGSSKSEWKDKQLAKASMSIITGAVFLIDSIFTLKG